MVFNIRDRDAREESADIPVPGRPTDSVCGAYLLPVPRSPSAVGGLEEKMAENLLVGQVGEGGGQYTLHCPIGLHL